jgi:hypothetical protein
MTMMRRSKRKTSAALVACALAGLGAGTAAHPPVPGGLWHEHEHGAGGARDARAAFAERHGFLAVWRAGAAAARQELVLDAGWPGFQASQERNLARGLRLADLETYATARGRRWAGLFRSGSGPQRLVAGLSLRDLDRLARSLAGRGLLPADVETWSEGGARRWAAVFSPGKGDYRLTAGDAEDAFSARWIELVTAGFGLADFEVYAEQGTPRYAGLFRAGEPAGTFWVGDAGAFHRRYHELAARGLRLADVETFRAGGRERYAALWRPGAGGDHLWVNGCPDPCAGGKELALQAAELQKKRAALPGL